MLLQQPALGTLYVEDEFMFFSFFAKYIYLKSRPGLESRPGQQQNGKGRKLFATRSLPGLRIF